MSSVAVRLWRWWSGRPRREAHVEEVGHLGDVGRWLDNAPECFVIRRPKSVPADRCVLVVMPRYFYVMALAVFFAFGLLLGHVYA